MTTFILITALTFGLAMDAFAVAVAQGAAGHNSSSNAIRIGAAFGAAQGIMPLVGWALGAAFLPVISAFDHWIALFLLVFLGAKMLWEARSVNADGPAGNLTGSALLTAAVATSIDALAAGITLPTLGLPVLLTSIAIGVVTGILSAIGVVIGGMASKRIGAIAEITGGFILIALGIKIFVEHQFFGV